MDDSGSSVEASYILCRVDWQYGLLVDEEFGVVYRKGHNSADVVRSVEKIDCIDRVMGFMDVGVRRYFLDQCAHRLSNTEEGSRGSNTLQVVKKRT